MYRLYFSIAALAFYPTPSQAMESIYFAVGDVILSAPLPDGYCVPQGDDKSLADKLASLDRTSFTLATLIRCDQAGKEGGYGDDFIVIKTPRRKLWITTTRDQILQSLANQMGKPDSETAEEMDSALKEAASDVSDIASKKVHVEGEVRPRGVDGICAYLGGTVSVSAEGISGTSLMGSCTTGVGGKIVTIYVQAPVSSNQSVEQLMQQARNLAGSIGQSSI